MSQIKLNISVCCIFHQKNKSITIKPIQKRIKRRLKNKII